MARLIFIIVALFVGILVGSIVAVEFAPTDWFLYEWGRQFLDALDSFWGQPFRGPNFNP